MSGIDRDLPGTWVAPDGRGDPTCVRDAVDLAILRLLAIDARISPRRIARKLEMSPSAIADRVARLGRIGVILG